MEELQTTNTVNTFKQHENRRVSSRQTAPKPSLLVRSVFRDSLPVWYDPRPTLVQPITCASLLGCIRKQHRTTLEPSLPPPLSTLSSRQYQAAPNMADVAAGLESLSLDPTPQAPRLPPSSATAIDKDGDLYLAVGPDGRAFQVDSRAIIRASEVWKKMVSPPPPLSLDPTHPRNKEIILTRAIPLQLTGGWAESRPAEGAWVVELSGDDPRAMEVVLHIIHLNNRHIPRRLSGEELFNVATLVDLYQVGGCLGLWAKTWCEPAVRELKGQAVQFEFQDLLRLTWIGWVFGNRVIFERAVNKLVLEVEIDGEGCLVDPAGIYLDEFRFLRAMDLESKACRFAS